MNPEEERRLAERLAGWMDAAGRGAAASASEAEIEGETDAVRLILTASEEEPVLSELFDRRLRTDLRKQVEERRGAREKRRGPSRIFVRYAMAATAVVGILWGAYVSNDLRNRSAPERIVFNPELESLTTPFSAEFDDAVQEIAERRKQNSRRTLMEEIQLRRLFERSFKS